MLAKLPPEPIAAENFLVDLGDSRVLNNCPLLWTGEFIGEFLALELLPTPADGDVNRCCNDWLKSMVTFKKKSQTDRFLPNSRADL